MHSKNRIHALRSFTVISPLALAAVLTLAACSSPAEKAERYYQNGMTLLEQGELEKARIEFQNSLQIVSAKSDAIYGLALIAERQGDLERMFGLLRRVVDINPKHLQAHVNIGRLLLASGDLNGATKSADSALSVGPSDPSALSLKAAILFRRGDKAGAIAQAKAVLATSPANVDALAVLAAERISSKDHDGAIAYIDIGLADNAANIPLHLFKIQILEAKGDVSGTELVFQHAISNADAKQKTGLRHAFAQFYLRHKNADKAEAQLRAIVADNPDDLATRLAIVRLARATKGDPAGVADLQAMIKADPDNYPLRFALAELYRQLKDTAAMHSVLTEIGQHADAKTALKARSLLASSFLDTGERAKASELVTAVLKEDPKQEDAMLLKASMEIDDRKIEQAIADLRVVLNDSPNSPRAHLLLGKAHESAGATELANAEYVKAYEGGKQAEVYGIAYAEFLLRHSNSARATQVIDDMLRASPRSVAVLQLLARSRMSQGDWAGAQEAADRIAARGQNKNIADQIRGTVYAQTRNYDASIKAFKSAYTEAPDNDRALAALVRSYVAAGKKQEAVAFLDSTLASNPANYVALQLKAQTLTLMKDQAGAQKAFERAVQVAPQNIDAYRNLAAFLSRQKRYADAKAAVERGLKQMPANLSLRMMLASVHEAAGEADAAISLYESLLQEHPGSEIVVNNLASLLSEHRDDPKSVTRAYELAQKLRQSEIPQLKDTVGWASYRAGHYPQAVSSLEQAAKQLPDVPVVRYHLGLAYKAQGNTQGARAQLEKALSLAEKTPFAEVERARTALAEL